MSDGTIVKECKLCPTNDGCETCEDSVCKTCKSGYFLSEDKLCYKCNAFQDGCEECNNAYTCKKCTANSGYIYDESINKCACI